MMFLDQTVSKIPLFFCITLFLACTTQNKRQEEAIKPYIEPKTEILYCNLIRFKKLFHIYGIQLDQDEDLELVIAEKGECGVTGNCFWSILDFDNKTLNFLEQGSLFCTSVGVQKSNRAMHNAIYAYINAGGGAFKTVVYKFTTDKYEECSSCADSNISIKNSMKSDMVYVSTFAKNENCKLIQALNRKISVDSVSLDTVGNIYFVLTMNDLNNMKVFLVEDSDFYPLEIGLFLGTQLFKSTSISNGLFDIKIVDDGQVSLFKFDGQTYQKDDEN